MGMLDTPGLFGVDVVVVGAGPTGLLLTHLLAKQGVSVCLMEQLPQVVGEARAVSIDDESLRSLADAKQLGAFSPWVTHSYGVHYYSCLQTLFAKVEPHVEDYGHPKRSAFRQQDLVKVLFEGLSAYPHVRVMMSTKVLSYREVSPDQNEDSQDQHQHQDQHQDQGQDQAQVRMRDEAQGSAPLAQDDFPLIVTYEGDQLPLGQPQEVRAKWMVGADGGRSSIRELMGTRLDGKTHPQRWLIADLVGRQDAFRHTRTYCDPKRPAIRLPGPQSTLRYEFMLFEHESSEEVLREEVYREWIRQRNPADAVLPLMRKVVYTFHARVANAWQKGRVFLAGDAAHLTPPFAGQGMNSGLRDASNLAWKLAEVVKGRAHAALLGTYELERKPHAWALIKMALRIGVVMQPRSMLGALLVQGLLKLACSVPRGRDYFLNLKFKPKPRFTEGFFDHRNPKGALITCGQLMIQPRLENALGQKVSMDSITGEGFAALVYADAPEFLWPPNLDLKVIKILRKEEDFLSPQDQAKAGVYRDAEGHLERILESAQAVGVVLRPDHYVLSYVLKGEQQLSRLDASLFGYYKKG
jgi:3-(3-hydroxy-phenyl)propionate hydroxylase